MHNTVLKINMCTAKDFAVRLYVRICISLSLLATNNQARDNPRTIYFLLQPVPIGTHHCSTASGVPFKIFKGAIMSIPGPLISGTFAYAVIAASLIAVVFFAMGARMISKENAS